MKRSLRIAAVIAPIAALLTVTAPAQANTDELITRQARLAANATAAPLQSESIQSLAARPGQLGISGCFMPTAPIFVTSGLESLQVWDVQRPEDPQLVGTLPNPVFENEAMNCGERRTKSGTERFALVGVDLYQASPDDPQHVNVGGGELIVVDVTDPESPTIRSRTPGSTSTHTVACATPRDCTHGYSAGDSRSQSFSIFDLTDLDRPHELDAAPAEPGLQAFSSPTAGHKWNFDDAGYGTHTGFDGSAMFDVRRPAEPRLVTTTGLAGRGDDPDFPGYNDFIHHNSYRPNARAFKADAAPSLANGNVLLVTEEDYEQTDCAKAGSFQTWWVKRLDGTPDAIVPLDKVELADLGNFPSPHGAFCSSHWFDYRSGGLAAVGFYGGGTQVLDVRDPRDIKPYAHSIWGASEVWDAMWVPVYKKGKQTGEKTQLVYSIDLVRGLDVYRVTLPGQEPPASTETTVSAPSPIGASGVPLGLLGGAVLASAALSRLRRRRTA
jgi:hypothetical protein